MRTIGPVRGDQLDRCVLTVALQQLLLPRRPSPGSLRRDLLRHPPCTQPCRAPPRRMGRAPRHPPSQPPDRLPAFAPGGSGARLGGEGLYWANYRCRPPRSGSANSGLSRSCTVTAVVAIPPNRGWLHRDARSRSVGQRTLPAARSHLRAGPAIRKDPDPTKGRVGVRVREIPDTAPLPGCSPLGHGTGPHHGEPPQELQVATQERQIIYENVPRHPCLPSSHSACTSGVPRLANRALLGTEQL